MKDDPIRDYQRIIELLDLLPKKEATEAIARLPGKTQVQAGQ